MQSLNIYNFKQTIIIRKDHCQRYKANNKPQEWLQDDQQQSSPRSCERSSCGDACWTCWRCGCTCCRGPSPSWTSCPCSSSGASCPCSDCSWCKRRTSLHENEGVFCCGSPEDTAHTRTVKKYKKLLITNNDNKYFLLISPKLHQSTWQSKL